MKSLQTIFTLASMLTVPWLLIQTSEAQTSQAESVQTSFDCTHLSIEEVDDALLTKAERLALMDKNLQTSMDKYDQCMSAAQQQMAGGGSGSAGGGHGGGEGGQGNGNSADAGQGSEGNQAQEQQTSQAANNASNQQSATSQQQSAQPSSQGSSTTNRPRQLSEPKDNDSIICKLLWQEIQSASPDKIEGFTKQYDDYKCG